MNIPRSISQPRKTRPFVSEIICEYWTTILNLESSHIPHTNFYNDIIFNDATEGQKTNKNWIQGTHTQLNLQGIGHSISRVGSYGLKMVRIREHHKPETHKGWNV